MKKLLRYHFLCPFILQPVNPTTNVHSVPQYLRPNQPTLNGGNARLLWKILITIDIRAKFKLGQAISLWAQNAGNRRWHNQLILIGGCGMDKLIWHKLGKDLYILGQVVNHDFLFSVIIIDRGRLHRWHRTSPCLRNNGPLNCVKSRVPRHLLCFQGRISTFFFWRWQLLQIGCEKANHKIDEDDNGEGHQFANIYQKPARIGVNCDTLSVPGVNDVRKEHKYQAEHVLPKRGDGYTNGEGVHRWLK